MTRERGGIGEGATRWAKARGMKLLEHEGEKREREREREEGEWRK
mgnify:CR=1 FL=1